MPTTQAYNKMAHRYDTCHDRWLRHAGETAQSAFEGAVTALLQSETRWLDAACGTGSTVRRILTSTRTTPDLVLLDAAHAMLERCRDLPARCVHGDLRALPFEANTFDLVTCSWALETVQSPYPALSELLRVTRTGGHVCLVFCARKPHRSMTGLALAQIMQHRRLARFLDPDMVAHLASTIGARTIRPITCRGPAAAMILSR